jgi:hypothetical protein
MVMPVIAMPMTMLRFSGRESTNGDSKSEETEDDALHECISPVAAGRSFAYLDARH